VKRTIDQITISELLDVTQAVAFSADPASAYEAVDSILVQRLEHKLFTVLRYVPQTHEVERVYSSHTDLYPIGGRKQNVDSLFGRTVIRDAKPMICHDDADVVANFPDFEKLRGLGVSGMINVPVVWEGSTIGSLNISGEAGQFGDNEIPALTVLAGMLAPVVRRNPA
jgi:hypothetical protein